MALLPLLPMIIVAALFGTGARILLPRLGVHGAPAWQRHVGNGFWIRPGSRQLRWALDVARGPLMISGPTMVISAWLIFSPPKRYLARVAARASARAPWALSSLFFRACGRL